MKYIHPLLPRLTIREIGGGRYEGVTVPEIGLTLHIDTFQRSRVIPGLMKMMEGRGLLERPEGYSPRYYADGQGADSP
jgi:hypothetical protein